ERGGGRDGAGAADVPGDHRGAAATSDRRVRRLPVEVAAPGGLTVRRRSVEARLRRAHPPFFASSPRPNRTSSGRNNVPAPYPRATRKTALYVESIFASSPDFQAAT